MNEGWKCPECGRCYAPWVKMCRADDCGAVQQRPGRVTIDPPSISPDVTAPTPRDQPDTVTVSPPWCAPPWWPPNTWDGSSAWVNVDDLPRSQWSYTN